MKAIKLLMLSIMAMPSLCFALGETDSMRCSKGIASTGDTVSELIDKCGTPTVKRGSGNTYKIGRTYYYGEEWIYDFGPQQFIYIAVISGNTVKVLYSTREIGTAKR